MKSWMMLAIAILCAGSVMAQRRARGGGARAEAKADQTIRISEITGVGGDSDYVSEAPQVEPKWKLKVNHKDTYKKDGGKGWHYFEVAYDVATVGTDSAGRKKPVLALPEVEVTYALLYDMKKSKLAGTVYRNAEKAGGAIGWDNPKQQYVLLTETVTYINITPGREHYAAVCVPPSFAAVYGVPMAFSVQIKVDGVQQGEIKTEAQGGAKVGTADLAAILVERKDGKQVPAAWWERIQNLTDAVMKVEGVLRDRSATPFGLVADAYYDQVKAK